MAGDLKVDFYSFFSSPSIRRGFQFGEGTMRRTGFFVTEFAQGFDYPAMHERGVTWRQGGGYSVAEERQREQHMRCVLKHWLGTYKVYRRKRGEGRLKALLSCELALARLGLDPYEYYKKDRL